MDDQETPKPEGWPVTIDDWSPDKVDSALHRLYELTINAAKDQINYYNRKAQVAREWSRWLRVFAIIAGTIGALVPLLQVGLGGTGREDLGMGPWGYVFLALAGAFLFADRAFGTSSSWIRFRRAQRQLSKRIVEFQTGWATAMSQMGGWEDEKKGIRQKLLQLQKEFALDIEQIVGDETEAWIAEFRTNLSELYRTYWRGGEQDGQEGDLATSRPRDGKETRAVA